MNANKCKYMSKNIWEKKLLRICTINFLPIHMPLSLLKFQSGIPHLASGRLSMLIFESVLSPSLSIEMLKHRHRSPDGSP